MNITYFTTADYSTDANMFIKMMIKLFEYSDLQYNAEITDDIISVIRNQSPDIAIIETRGESLYRVKDILLSVESNNLSTNIVCLYDEKLHQKHLITTWYKYGAFGVMNLPFEEQSLKNEICRYLNR